MARKLPREGAMATILFGVEVHSASDSGHSCQQWYRGAGANADRSALWLAIEIAYMINHSHQTIMAEAATVDAVGSCEGSGVGSVS